jgi:hypothetical protein
MKNSENSEIPICCLCGSFAGSLNFLIVVFGGGEEGKVVFEVMKAFSRVEGAFEQAMIACEVSTFVL